MTWVLGHINVGSWRSDGPALSAVGKLALKHCWSPIVVDTYLVVPSWV